VPCGAVDQIRAAPAEPGQVGRLEVDEVGDHGQCLVEGLAGQEAARGRLEVEDGVPGVQFGQALQPPRTVDGEEVGERGIVGAVTPVYIAALVVNFRIRRDEGRPDHNRSSGTSTPWQIQSTRALTLLAGRFYAAHPPRRPLPRARCAAGGPSCLPGRARCRRRCGTRSGRARNTAPSRSRAHASHRYRRGCPTRAECVAHRGRDQGIQPRRRAVTGLGGATRDDDVFRAGRLPTVADDRFEGERAGE